MGNIIVTLKPGRSSTSTSASSSSEISVTNITELSNEIVTNDKLVSVGPQTVKANITEDFSAPQDIALSTFTGYLSVFTGDGGEGGAQGLVPAPQSGDSGKFLRGDGSWSELPETNNVAGPASSGNGNIVLFDQATGKIIKDSGKTLDSYKAEILAEAPGGDSSTALVFAIALG